MAPFDKDERMLLLKKRLSLYGKTMTTQMLVFYPFFAFIFKYVHIFLYLEGRPGVPSLQCKSSLSYNHCTRTVYYGVKPKGFPKCM